MSEFPAGANAKLEDAKLQPDPQLDAGRTGVAGTAIAFGAMLAVVFGVLFGINNRRIETINSAGEVSAAAQQQSGNVPPAQTAADSGQSNERRQPETTGSGEKAVQPEPEPAKPATGGSQR